MKLIIWKPRAEIVARIVLAGILLGLYALLTVEGL